MLRRFFKRWFTRRQLAALCLVAVVEGVALAVGVLGYEAAAWAGLMISNLAVLAVLFRVLGRVRDLDESESRRWSEAEARAAAEQQVAEQEVDEERTELLLRRILAAVEHERHQNARRFEQLAKDRGAAEEYDPA
ncbi:hypothetical protein L0U85_11135 [Glycomyces sp. L485]|uniref:hypothetical protein n=1 Tax=Glycomyces sp. L485 TaxID=2909235 RepID=UPI001F4AD434|nr:hypothetical protein [Glycomyces sp. L485]MCH7231397.1 hypothetical protein [Glycomyces sp. L485]